jgi:glycine cleavage system H protein
MDLPKELKYTKEHEWARTEGEFAVIGITDYAQEKLGAIVFIDLPAPGKVFKQGEIMVSVDSVKAVAEIYAPVSGRVEATHEPLKDNPEVVNRDPYGEGWMVKLKITDFAELDNLLSWEAYGAFVAEEEEKG